MNNQNSHHQPLPLDEGSTQRLAAVSRPFIRLLGVLILFLVMEALWGHPAIRWSWTGYGDSPSSCTLVTIGFERHFVVGSQPYITFIEPDHKLGPFLWEKAVDTKEALIDQLQAAISGL